MDVVVDIIQNYWPFLLIALLIGMITGWFASAGPTDNV